MEIQEDSAEILTGLKEEILEKKLRCIAQPVTNAAQDAKFLSSQAGASQFTAVIVLEKVKILNQRVLINIKKSLT